MAIWHDVTLEDAIQDLVKDAPLIAAACDSDQLPPFKSEKNTEQVLEDHEIRLGRPIPTPVREVFLKLTGVSSELRWMRTLTSTILQTVADSDWVDIYNEFDVENSDSPWIRDDYYNFAQTTDGVGITYCASPPNLRPGSIIMFDSECDNELLDLYSKEDCYTPIVILADSLAEWLVRWKACGYEELAFPGIAKEGPPAVLRDFLEDHIRLNPTVVWAKEQLAELGANTA